MAEIIENSSGKGSGGGKRKPKKYSAAIDMTPMVDLMCLLITFFMLTTAFSKPKVMEIVLPDKTIDTNIKPMPIDKNRAVTIIMAENDIIYYYEGLAKADSLPSLIKTDYSKDGIRKFLLKRNKPLLEQIIAFKEKITKGELVLPRDSVNSELKKLRNKDKVGPIILIKAADNIKYKNFVDIIDEMAITNIARYAIVDLNHLELKMLETAPK